MLRALAQAALPRALAQFGSAAERSACDAAIAVACSGSGSGSSNSSGGAARLAGGGAAAAPGGAARAGPVCGCARCCRRTRAVHTSASARHGGGDKADGETISVTFISDKDGSETTVKGTVGKSLLEVAHDNDVELEGACEGSLACSTCHVVLEQDVYDKLEEPCEDELDMLDLAFGLTPTSRLGCQVVAARELDGLRVRLPSATRNFYVGEGGEGGEGSASASAAAPAASPAATK